MVHPGFLKAICEEPDDDAHRLIYADWLDDHGDPDRAEFIRLQCALARLDDEDEAMQAREAELLRRHGDAWRDELPDLPKVVWQDPFRRGFVKSASVPNYTAWQKQGLALLAAAPLEWVSLYQMTPRTVRLLARSPGIERVRGLEFPDANFGDSDLEVLGESCRLRVFRFHGRGQGASNLGHDAGRILGTSPGFRRLRQLHLVATPLHNGVATDLTSAPNFVELEEFRLISCGLTAISFDSLLAHVSWNRLRLLDVSANNIRDEGVRKIASCPGMTNLRELWMTHCQVGDAGVTAIARSMFLTNLRLLELGYGEFGADGLHALMTSSNLRTLRSLTFFSYNITGADIVALLRSPLGANLRELNVCGRPIDAESAAAIVVLPGLENLTRLFVSEGEADDLLRRRFGDRITIL